MLFASEREVKAYLKAANHQELEELLLQLYQQKPEVKAFITLKVQNDQNQKEVKLEYELIINELLQGKEIQYPILYDVLRQYANNTNPKQAMNQILRVCKELLRRQEELADLYFMKIFPLFIELFSTKGTMQDYEELDPLMIEIINAGRLVAEVEPYINTICMYFYEIAKEFRT